MILNYNSFSQIKGLTWVKNYENIISWTKGKEKLLPPVGVTIDLTTTCNIRCKGCNAYRSWNKHNTLNTEEVYKIIDYLKKWRIETGRKDVLKSCCFAGGGEPTLNPDFSKIITYAHKAGFEIGISTNGTLLNKDNIKAIVEHAEFCGISMDSGSSKVWCDYKRVDVKVYKNVIKGIKNLMVYYNKFNRKGRKVDLVYKYLITPFNQHDILKGAKLAKKLGFKTFYVRPAAMANLEIFGGKDKKLDVDSIFEQIKKAKKLQGKGFIIQSSFNRVNKKLGKVHKFKTCRTTPLLTQFCADGYLYTCIDKRYIKEHKLVHWTEVKEYWGSKKHLSFVKKIKVSNCSRCAFGNYNEQIEKCVVGDELYRWFP